MSSNGNNDSDDDIMEVEEVKRPPPPVAAESDLVTLEGDEVNVPGSSEEGTGRRRSKRSIAQKDYAEDSDVEEDSARKYQSPRSHVITDLRNYVVAHRKANGSLTKLPSSVVQVYFYGDASIRLEDFTLFWKANQHIKSVRMDTINVQLLMKLSMCCQKLESLYIGGSEWVSESEENGHDENQQESALSPMKGNLVFPHLTKIRFDGRNPFLKVANNLKLLLSFLPKTIEEFHYMFPSPQEASRFLKAISAKKLQFKYLTLEHVKAESNHKTEDATLHREQIVLITNLNLNLRSLQLTCGIWEDVTATDLANLLTKFATTLQHFTIAESLQGVDSADGQLKLQVPHLPELLSFSMGSVYEFKEEYEDTQTQDSDTDKSDDEDEENVPLNGRDGHQVISLDKPDLIKIKISFHPMPSLLSLSLGNLIHVDRISPSLFPNLKTLHIGSDWTTTLNIPTTPTSDEFPVFKFVRELQLPDFMVDQFFMLNIRKMFPALRKVTMKFPTMKCLRYFFHAMADSALQSLNLKTSCDFKGMLEDALFPGRQHPLVTQHHTLMKLFKLEEKDNNTMFKEFVDKKGIELPIWTESLDDEILNRRKYGIANLPELTSLSIGHLPRTIQIPRNNKISHNHADQTFRTECRVGFRKYPLSKKFLRKDLYKLRNLIKFNHGSNFELPVKYKLFNQVEFEGNRSCRYRDKTLHSYADSSDEDRHDTGFEAFGSSGDAFPSTSRKKRKLTVSRKSVASKQFKIKKEEPKDETDLKPDIKPQTITRLNGNEANQEMTARVKQE